MVARAQAKSDSRRWSIASLPNMITGPQALAFLPAISLASYWFGGEIALISAALAVPLVIALLGVFDGEGRRRPSASGALNDLNAKAKLIESLSSTMTGSKASSQASLCLAIELDEFKSIEERYGRKAGEEIIAKTAERIADSVREFDVIACVDPA
ncbi:MAG: diguanylate cyclase, partial [Pseudomonadota bacterium]